MKQKEVFKKIGGIIRELNDQYEYLKTTEDSLNDLELELFVSNAHFLTDHIEILCKLNLQNHKINLPPIIDKPAKEAKQEKEKKDEKQGSPYEQKYFEPVVQQMKPAVGPTNIKPLTNHEKPAKIELVKPHDNDPVPYIDLESNAAGDTYSFIREEPETIRHELILDEADNFEEEEILQENDIPETEPETPIFEEPVKIPTVATNVSHADVKVETSFKAHSESDDIVTINQKISAQMGDKANSVTEQSSVKPISDIKQAITLNDKLLYVKDLFNGYNLAYSEAVEILNRFNTFEEASRFLKTNYVTKNNWESKPSTTEKFYALLRRRYVD